jgi:hypothetical protein
MDWLTAVSPSRYLFWAPHPADSSRRRSASEARQVDQDNKLRDSRSSCLDKISLYCQSIYVDILYNIGFTHSTPPASLHAKHRRIV